MAPEPKDDRVNLRVSRIEHDMLRDLANDVGESEATVIRRLIREAHAKRQVPSKRSRKER